MSYSYSGTNTFDASATLLDNGDQVSKTSMMQGIIEKLFNRTTFLKTITDALYNAVHTYTALQTFAAGLSLTGGNLNLAAAATVAVEKLDTTHRASLTAFTADVATGNWLIGSNSTGSPINITLRHSTAPVPTEGQRIRIFYLIVVAATSTWLVKNEGGTTLATFPTGANTGAWAEFIWDGSGGAWRLFSFGGGVTSP